MPLWRLDRLGRSMSDLVKLITEKMLEDDSETVGNPEDETDTIDFKKVDRAWGIESADRP